ncbi:hypothetical protein D3C81_1077760 [compost metagenome]
MAFGGVLEVVEHPLFLQQALDEVEVGFTVLGDVGVALLRAGQAKLVTGKCRAQGEHFSDDFLDRITLEDPCIEAVLEHRKPGIKRRGVARHATVTANAGEAREVAGEIARTAFGQFDLDAYLLAHHRLERHAGLFAHQQQLVVEGLRQAFHTLEGFEQ